MQFRIRNCDRIALALYSGQKNKMQIKDSKSWGKGKKLVKLHKLRKNQQWVFISSFARDGLWEKKYLRSILRLLAELHVISTPMLVRAMWLMKQVNPKSLVLDIITHVCKILIQMFLVSE